MTPGDVWTAERIDWLRRFHRDRRGASTGPLGEATWAVSLDGTVVGSVRLERTAEPEVLETGIGLTRSVRGRGVGRLAVAAVLERAGRLGAREVCADTSPHNAPALAAAPAPGVPDGARTGIV